MAAALALADAEGHIYEVLYAHEGVDERPSERDAGAAAAG
jgi:hypothetical protein